MEGEGHNNEGGGLDILARSAGSPTGSLGEVAWQMDSAADTLAVFSRQMLRDGWKSHDEWFQDLVGIESNLRVWLNRVRQERDPAKRTGVLPSLLGFRNQLKVFTELFSNNLLFLKGAVSLVDCRRQRYSARGVAAGECEKASHIDFRDEE